jgi:aspartyl protease family protein
MALSLSGRKILFEVSACVGALVVGIVAFNHFKGRNQATSLDIASVTARKATGLPEAQAPKLRRSTELTAQRNGHFFAEAEFNGRSVNVMVDTGASMVALTYDDARRAGIAPLDSEFTRRANTANGIAKFAPIVIDRISIGDVEVRNVEAAVMEEGKLDTTLLGMSFLGKLGRVDMRSGKLVLEE